MPPYCHKHKRYHSPHHDSRFFPDYWDCPECVRMAHKDKMRGKKKRLNK